MSNIEGERARQRCISVVDARRYDIKALSRVVSDVVDSHGIVLLKNLDPTPAALAHLAQCLGSPMVKAQERGRVNGSSYGDVTEIVGDVRYRSDVDSDKRSPTQGCSAIGMHTARSYSPERPKYFALLMANVGWRGEAAGNNGESYFAHVADVLALYRTVFPQFYASDIRALTDIPIAYRPEYWHDSVANEPLLKVESGRVTIRCWESLLNGLDIGELPDGFASAAGRLAHILAQSAVRLEISMEEGDVVVVDNESVLHGRAAFVGSRMGSRGTAMEYTSRQVYSVHIACRDDVRA